MDELLATGIPVVEDFSHAHFSKYKGKHVGTLGIAGFCSTQRKKLISTGEGGIITTNSDKLASFMPEIISPGSTNSADMSGYGYNMKMSPFSICALQEQLENRHELFSVRNDRVKSLEEEVRSKGGTPPLLPADCEVNWYGYKPAFDPSVSMTFAYEPFSYEVANQLAYWYKEEVPSWRSFVLESDLTGLHQFLNNRMSVKW
jgi:dTDP-4-amino-4,6-dideoxygalactose transaminase